MSMVDVVIVGAGLSGLITAQRLAACGVDSVILEARARIGGRLFASHDAELGGEFIARHHSRVRQLASDIGSVLDPVERGADTLVPQKVVLDGRTLSTRERRALLMELERAIADICRVARTAPAHWRRFDGVSIETWLQQQGYSAALVAIFSDLPAHAMSMHALLLMVGAAGGEAFFHELEHERLRDGTASLLSAIRRSPSRRIRHSSAVSAIVRRRRGVSVEIRGRYGRSRLNARAVVVTIPPPCISRIEGLEAYAAMLPPMAVTRKCVVRIRGPLTPRELLSNGPCRTISVDGRSLHVYSLDRASSARHLAMTALAMLDISKRRLLSYETMRWNASPWSRGSYPVFGFGSMHRFESIRWDVLRPVFFAGDFRVPAYAGYMEGAVRSAEMVSDDVLQYLRRHA